MVTAPRKAGNTVTLKTTFTKCFQLCLVQLRRGKVENTVFGGQKDSSFKVTNKETVIVKEVSIARRAASVFMGPGHPGIPKSLEPWSKRSWLRLELAQELGILTFIVWVFLIL